MKTQHAGPLNGLTVLDLSRILAGPSCTQLLGDMGADIIKVERPNVGDDTRKWGPPYLKDKNENDTSESAYYLSCNRNKRSITIDITQEKGQQLIRDLVKQADIFIENFKVGSLAKYGLAYDDLALIKPDLIYCSISGFGQTGPYANRPGYDFLIQAMGGIMSFTGEPEGQPMKVGVGIADVVCGMYASNAILGALHHKTKTGEGQYIDISLLDTQVSWLVNGAVNYLTSGELPERYGNGHPNIVPYETFTSQDGFFVLAIGNDEQFRRFCEFAKVPDMANDPLFSSNECRVKNRKKLIPLLNAITDKESTDYWLTNLENIQVPCGPVNDMEQVFSDPQVQHRQMQISIHHPQAENKEISLIGNPIKYSLTPIQYKRHPPTLGENSEEILSTKLGLTSKDIDKLKQQGIV